MTFACENIDITTLSQVFPSVGIFEDGSLTPSAKKLDKLSRGKISQLLKAGLFIPKVGTHFLLPQLAPLSCPVLLIGCGQKTQLTALTFKKIIATATHSLSSANIKQTICYLSECFPAQNPEWLAKIIVETVFDTLYQFNIFKSKADPSFHFKKFIIASGANKKQMDVGLKQGLAIAQGVTLTKNLANTPSNICTPTFLAQQAQSLVKGYASLSIDIINEKQMQKLGMGALLGVSQGSAEEAKLISIHYKGTKIKRAPIVLVGKGITFDTGGNSLKPADSMVGMKYDMCGAATVLGVMQALAELKLPINVIGVLAAAENMPGGTAYKPEDILTSMSGQTIEVISTDAEGRLVLCDALTYCERFQPEVVIDIATLTGAVVIALGSQASAILSNHQPLANDLLAASAESADRAWQLPLWDEYQEQLKSPFADMANVGGREAGAITAGCFLARFTKKFKWAHLDVAGTAAFMSNTAARRATGRPVPLLMQYLINRVNK